MRKSILIFISFFLLELSASAQNDDWDMLVEELAEESYTADNADDAEAIADQIDELTDFHEHPFDLNTATPEQLSRLPFLTDAQVKAIVDHRLRYGSFRSAEELTLVEGLGLQELRWLRQCVYAGGESLASQRAYSQTYRHELMTRLDVPFYESAGWPWAKGLAHRLRYTSQLRGRWSLGVRAEKDAGEPMFNRQNPLWDAWGGHAVLSDWRCIETLVVGDYKASMGEGLVINTGFQLGKQTTSLWRRKAVLRPHRSTDEVNFLRGAAVTLKFASPISLTFLYSYRQLDATVQPDNSVRTANLSGLHRTASELARRRSLDCHTTAAHLAWNASAVRLGASAMYQRYDHQFLQGSALYRQIYPEGYQFGALSADYALRLSHFYFSGETARSFAARNRRPDALNNSSGSGWATLNKAMWRFSPNAALTAIGRFYSRNYFSALSSAYAENSRVQNESGAALLFDVDRVGPFDLRAFVDVFYSPWPRYTMTRASHGFEAAIRATCKIDNKRDLSAHYNYKSKERSDRRYLTNRLRLTYAETLSRRLTLQTSVFATRVSTSSPSQHAAGLALSPRINYSVSDGRLRCSLSATLFATGLGSPAAYSSAAYDSRLYLYESSLFQSFGMLSLYGKGERVAATLRWQASSRWQLQAKCGLTHYHDRDHISSGPTEIASRWRTDLQLLARWLLR